MYKKILVPMALDHDVSSSTLEIARALSAGGGEIIALHVYEAPQGSVNAYVSKDAQKEGVERAKADLQEKTAHLEGIRAEMVIGHTYRSIIDFASEHSIDCIVLGSHKPGFSDFLLGSTAARVVRHAPCAVHVFRS